jgi:hypothetical protein
MKRLALVIGVALPVLLVAVASAELVGSADQVVSFDAQIRPVRLLRHDELPITIRAHGSLRPTAKKVLARVNSLQIEINRHGKLFMAGLPICHLKQLVATFVRNALAACGPALVGHGKIGAKQVFPEQGVFPIKGSLLMFNGRYKGERVIFLHVHSVSPPSTIIVPFKIRQTQGTFGTVLTAHISKFLNRWLYLSRFEFVLGRKFAYRGKEHGYVQATCPAPHGSDTAIVPFARVTFQFPATKTLRTTLVRACRVRNEKQR